MLKNKQTNSNLKQSITTIVNTRRTGMDVESLKAAVTKILFYQQGHNTANASLNDVYLAVLYAVRDRIKIRELTNMDAVMQYKDGRIISYL